MRIGKALLSLAVIALAAVAQPIQVSAQTSRPNIIVILGDDYGWPYYNFMWQHLGDTLANFEPGYNTDGCYDPESTCQMHIATPNLDRLAREGIVFEHGYATESACQPAHESLYTGLNQRDLGLATKVGCYPGVGVVDGAQTFAEALKAGSGSFTGYNTFKAGRFYGPDTAWTELTDEREVGERESMSAVKRFISDQSSSKPWLVLWTPLTPHEEYAGIPAHIDGDYATMEVTNPPHITSIYAPATTRHYFEAITYFDERIGELVEHLELLEARSCDLGPSYYASDGLPADGIPTVYDPTTNPVNQTPNRRILKEVSCGASAGQPCPAPASDCPTLSQPAACDPDPYYDPYGYDSSWPAGVTTDDKCKSGTPTYPSPADKYAGFRTNTVIIYLMDNGAAIEHAKGQFSENGLRTPIIVNYPKKIAPHGRLNPTLFPHPALVGSIDVFPSLLQYAQIPSRVFPDARSFVDLTQDPWTNYPAHWRRYFYLNSEPSTTGMYAVTDSVPATYAGNQETFKIEANNNVLTPSNVKRITNITEDPFEEYFPAKWAPFLPGTSGPKYPGNVDVMTHLQSVLNYWKIDNGTGCLTACQRCKVVTALSDVACGGTADSCGSCTVPSLPCRYTGEG